MNELPRPEITVGNCLDVLADMPAESVHCVITSPPYWSLRAYHGDEGMIGLEPTLEAHIERLVDVFREVRRVLRKDGTLWLNYGDAYWSNPGNNREDENVGSSFSNGQRDIRAKKGKAFKPKDLMLMPARVALALQADGWWLRSEIIWHKPNPMPESVTDRPTSAHEKVFLFSKAPRYFYDAEAVRTERIDPENRNDWQRAKLGSAVDKRTDAYKPDKHQIKGANLRNVWQIATESYRGAHFATMPQKLVEPCIKAGTSAKGVCSECGAPWGRQVEKNLRPSRGRLYTESPKSDAREANNHGSNRYADGHLPGSYEVKPLGWSSSCACNADLSPAVVMDCFGGAGTVGLVAQRLGRRSICIEISPEYAEMARQRIEQARPLTHRRNEADPDAFKLDFSP